MQLGFLNAFDMHIYPNADLFKKVVKQIKDGGCLCLS